MILIGELINATRKRVARAIGKRDEGFIRELAQAQEKNGAAYIDLNAGTGKGRDREKEDIGWLMETVSGSVDAGLCIDSADPDVIRHCMSLSKGRKLMINSISGEEKSISLLLPIMKEHPECNIICLAMDDSGIPPDTGKRVEIGGKLLSLLREAGVPPENIFMDALVQPVSTDSANGLIFLESIREIKKRFPSVNTTCGLSNVSFGLPDRGMLNRHFLAMSMACGLDSAIVDPLSPGIREAVSAASALIGKDEYCMNYIRKCRESLE